MEKTKEKGKWFLIDSSPLKTLIRKKYSFKYNIHLKFHPLTGPDYIIYAILAGVHGVVRGIKKKIFFFDKVEFFFCPWIRNEYGF